MLQNVINSIIEAEAEAEKIVKEATVNAKEDFLKAKADSEAMIKQNADDVKRQLKAVEQEAESLANAAYDEIIKKGETESRKLFENSLSAIDEAGKYIAGRLLEKYGNS